MARPAVSTATLKDVEAGFAGTPGNTQTSDGKTTITFDFSKIDPKGGSIDTEKAADVAHEGEHGVVQKARGGRT